MNICVCGFVTWLVKTREAVLYMSVTAVAIPVEVVSQEECAAQQCHTARNPGGTPISMFTQTYTGTFAHDLWEIAQILKFTQRHVSLKCTVVIYSAWQSLCLEY